MGEAKKAERRRRAQVREAARIEDPEQAIKDLLAKRTISNQLQPILDEREAARVAARAEVVTGGGEELHTETETGTITRYIAWSYPHGHLVIEMPSRLVEDKFDSRDEAETHADQLNTWLLRRPTKGASYRRFVLPPEPTEASLIDMLDRMAEIDRDPVAAFKTLDAAVSAALDDAEVADRAAARQRAATWQEPSQALLEGDQDDPAELVSGDPDFAEADE